MTAVATSVTREYIALRVRLVITRWQETRHARRHVTLQEHPALRVDQRVMGLRIPSVVYQGGDEGMRVVHWKEREVNKRTVCTSSILC
jgi:hypothetical protein